MSQSAELRRIDSEFHPVLLSPGSAPVEAEDLVVRTVDGSRCRTSRDLFDEFARQIPFPGYFGRNWDAFDECIRDLDELEGSTPFVLVVTDAQDLLADEDGTLGLFAESVADAQEHWSTADDDDPDDETARPARAYHLVLLAVESEQDEVRRRWSASGVDLS